MRMPNGYGSVSKISSKSSRRNPYRVSILTGWTDEGKAIRKTIGYAKSKKEGMQLLADYNNNKFDKNAENISFSYLFEEYYKWKKTKISDHKRILFVVKYYDDIKNKPFADITRLDLQRIIDEKAKDYTADYQRRIITVYKQMHAFALSNNIKVGVDVSKLITYAKEVPSKLHKPFTDEEIKIIWDNRGKNKIYDIILINIYTGCRPNELLKISEVHDDYFITGSKTEAGKNRVIPLHNKIKGIFRNAWENQFFEYSGIDSYYQMFKRVLKDVSMDYHSPYDCRHTFATLADQFSLNEHIIKLIMGHRIADITKRVYTHKKIEELIEEINKIEI